MESEPRAVPYRGAHPDAHLSAEICPGPPSGSSPKTDVRPRCLVLLCARIQTRTKIEIRKPRLNPDGASCKVEYSIIEHSIMNGQFDAVFPVSSLYVREKEF